MELRHLRYLIAVADAGTFVRAAEVLRVAQPALSRQINDLEEELGVELFETGARKATLTLAGEAAVRIARHVIEDTERAIARARMSSEGLLGGINIMCGPVPLAIGMMGQLIRRLRARHPAITVHVQEGSFPLQWDCIADATADIGLGASPPEDYKSLAAEAQFTHVVDQAVVVAEHPLAGRESVRLAELSRTPYLGLEVTSPDTDHVRELLLREFKRQGIDPGQIRMFPSLDSLLAHVRAGQGWTLLPRLFVPTLKPLVGLRIEDFQAPFRTMRCWRRADTRPVTQTVLRELRAMQEQGLAESGFVVETPEEQPPREFVPARLDLRHLRSFLRVAELGSIGRAAEELSITQPALSRQMRELEYDVGVELLERVTRGVELTPAGQELESDARGVLAVVDRLPAEVRRVKRGAQERRCLIGVVPHPHVNTLVALAVSEMESRVPRIRVGTRAVETPSQPNALRASEIDLGVLFSYPARVPADALLARVRLFDDEMSHALLAVGHSLAKAPVVSLNDLASVPFLFPGRALFPPFYDVVMHQFELAQVKPRIEGEYKGLQTIWSLTSQGLGWSLGWREQRHEPPPGTISVPIADFRLPWGVDLLYRKDESRAPILATIDALRESARQLFGAPATAPDGAFRPFDTSRAVIS